MELCNLRIVDADEWAYETVKMLTRSEGPFANLVNAGFNGSVVCAIVVDTVYTMLYQMAMAAVEDDRPADPAAWAREVLQLACDRVGMDCPSDDEAPFTPNIAIAFIDGPPPKLNFEDDPGGISE